MEDDAQKKEKKQKLQAQNRTEMFLAVTFPDMNKDFGFRTLTMHLTCFRKTAEQSFPDCKQGCVLVDYVDKKITVNGFVDYLRHYQDDKTGWLYRTFAS